MRLRLCLILFTGLGKYLAHSMCPVKTCRIKKSRVHSSKEVPDLPLSVGLHYSSHLFLPVLFMLEPEQSCNPFDWHPPGLELLFCEERLVTSLPPPGACVCLPGSPPLPFLLGFVFTPWSRLASSKRAPLSLVPSFVLHHAIIPHSSGGPHIPGNHCPSSRVETSLGFHGKTPLHCGLSPPCSEHTHLWGHRHLCKHFTNASQAISTLKEGNLLECSCSIKKRTGEQKVVLSLSFVDFLGRLLACFKADWQASILSLCLPESLATANVSGHTHPRAGVCMGSHILWSSRLQQFCLQVTSQPAPAARALVKTSVLPTLTSGNASRQ